MMSTCSLCSGEFDRGKEGGVEGDIGILPVAFCPTCLAGVLDRADQMRPPEQCVFCGHWNDEE